MLPSHKFKKTLISTLVSLSLLGTASCSKKEETATAKAPAASIISTTTVTPMLLENVVSSIGVINSISSPTISAETSGRVIDIKKDIGQSVEKDEVIAIIDSEIARLSVQEAEAALNRLRALLKNQEKSNKRNKELLKKGFISDARYDDSSSQLSATRQQYKQASASLEKAKEHLSKTSIRSPVTGNIVSRSISPGDFVSPGKPVFKISTSDNFQVVLLFPETSSAQFKKGLKVRLSSAASPDVTSIGEITDIVSKIDTRNRSVRLVVDVANPGGWYPGASVLGEIILSQQPNALTVPQQSVILRPAGNVVYAIENNVAKQRVVTTGMRQKGLIEITSGLEAQQVIAKDGAGFLTHNTPVKVQGAN